METAEKGRPTGRGCTGARRVLRGEGGEGVRRPGV